MILTQTARQLRQIVLRRQGGGRFLKEGSKHFSTDSPDDDKSSTLNLAQPSKRPLKPSSVNVQDVDGNLVEAAQVVAGHLNKNDAEAKRNASNSLLERLKKISDDTKAAKSSGGEISSLYSSLNVKSDKPPAPQNELTSEQKAFLERRKARRKEARERKDEMSSNYVAGDLFGAKPLGIFRSDFKEKDPCVELKTWDSCLQRDLNILITPRPKNFLEEMIVMTDRGMLWQLPLNNEFGIKDEELEPFHLHVFLEKHLEPWCPKAGPIRHFMELVTVGLSKNPYMTIDKKIEHIKWFEEYLMASDKQEIFNIMETDSPPSLPPPS